MQVKVFRDLAQNSLVWICGYKPSLKSPTFKATINVQPIQVKLEAFRIKIGKKTILQKDCVGQKGDYRVFTTLEECVECYEKMTKHWDDIIQGKLIRMRTSAKAVELRNISNVQKWKRKVEEQKYTK